jgi:D-alanyl-lipoteichoic acid acyltransferase DltB (MBOAT superfamily)
MAWIVRVDRTMLFHSHIFILGFLPACLLGFFLLGRIGGSAWALRWLLAASLVFYGWWDAALVPLLLGSVLVNWGLGRLIAAQSDRRRALRWFVIGIAVNLGLLGWFKYAGFVWGMLAPESPALQIVLPLAISFFTFQQIMALGDSLPASAGPGRMVEGRSRTDRPPGGILEAPLNGPLELPRGEPPPARSLLSHATFVAFFPHLIAGPLVRPGEIIPQLLAPDLATPRSGNLTEGLTIFLLGLAKKLVLADPFGAFADAGFDAAARGETLSFFEAWYALLAYALQIYFDFSGYSDMAIGLARMFNIRFPLNFDSPYQARSIADFWRRWHITLGLFLRDYIYIPLGGSRTGLGRQVGALLVTMLLCGLWHGAAWRFVLWGGVHGVYLAVHTLYRRLGPPLPGPLAHGLTLLAVVLAWVPFRAADLPTAGAFLLALCGANGIALPAMVLDFAPILAGIADPVPVLRFLGDARTLSFVEVSACLALGWAIVLIPPHLHAWPGRRRAWALAGGFAFTIQALFFAPNVAPFLYFQF